MPQLYNGCGTWYHGKAERHVVDGVCSQCGSEARLSSYNTTKYFQLLYVPLIPVSKWRVMDECSVCTRHGAMPLAKWEEAKAEAVGGVTAKLAEDREKPENVIEALQVACGFQDGRLYEAVAGHLAGPLEHDAEVQATLGEAHAYFSRPDLAAEAFERSLAAKDSDEVRQRLAVQQIALGRPEDAERTLGPILDKPPAEGEGDLRVPWAMTLAGGYASTGRHDDADRLYDRVEEIAPDAAKDKNFKKARKAAAKARKSGKVTATPFQPSKNTGYSENAGSGGLVKWIGPAIAAGLLALYFGTAVYKGLNRDVRFVSGLPVDQTVTIGGNAYELRPHESTWISLGEGDFEFTSVAPPYEDFTGEVEIETGFFGRPFTSPTFVFNPDANAVIVDEWNVYAERAADQTGGYELLHGQTLYEFRGVDYPFKQFPDTLRVSDKKKSVRKTRLDTVTPRDLPPSDLASAVFTEVGPAAAARFSAVEAVANPDDEDLLQMAIALNEEPLDLLRKNLDRDPPLVEWHRMYQSVAGQDAEVDLVAEYDRRLAASPENAALQYLRGRVEPDRATAAGFFEEAMRLDPEFAYAPAALAYAALSAGEFEKAAEYAEAAFAIDTENDNARAMRHDARLATRDRRGILASAESERAGGEIENLTQLVADFTFAREPRTAADVVNDTPDEQRTYQSGVGSSDGARAYFLAMIEYAKGDLAEAVWRADKDIEAGEVEPATAYRLAVMRRDLDAAAAAVGERSAADSSLTLALLAHLKGEAEQADAFIDSAAEMIAAYGADGRQFAGFLTGDAPPPMDAVRDNGLPVSLKMLAVAALGIRFESVREEAFAFAGRLNFNPVFPKLLVDEVVSKP